MFSHVSLELQVFVWLCSFFVSTSRRTSLSASSTEFARKPSPGLCRVPGESLYNVFASLSEEAIDQFFFSFLFRVLVVPKNKKGTMLQLRILFFCLESLPARISQSKSAAYIAFLITHPRIRPVWVMCVSCVADSWDRDFGVIWALKM